MDENNDEIFQKKNNYFFRSKEARLQNAKLGHEVILHVKNSLEEGNKLKIDFEKITIKMH